MLWFLSFLLILIVVALSFFVKFQIEEKEEIFEDVLVLHEHLIKHLEFLQAMEKMDIYVMNETLKEMILKNKNLKVIIEEFLELYNIEGDESDENSRENQEKKERT